MADRRKRRQPLGSMPTARQQQRKRPRYPEILTIVKAAVAIAILLSVVATTAAVVQGSAPKTRQRIHEPRRLVWEEHRVDLASRGMFRRMYRMEEQTFNLESVHKICRQNLSKIKLCDWPNKLDATSWQVLNTTEYVKMDRF